MCEACGRKPLSVYNETIKNHVRGTWHKKALEKFQASQASKQVCFFACVPRSAAGKFENLKMCECVCSVC